MDFLNLALEKLEFYKVLDKVKDHAITSSAKDFILNEKPYFDLDFIKSKLDDLDLVVKFNRTYGPLVFVNYLNLKHITDVLSKNGVLDSIDFLEILNLIKAKEDIVGYLKQAKEKYDVSVFLNDFKTEPFSQIRSMILSKIKDDGSILNSASINLERLRAKKNSIEHNIKQKLQDIIKRDKAKLSESIYTFRDNRFTLLYKIEYKNKIDGICRDISNTNTTCYIEPRCILNDTDELLQTISDIKIEEREILKKLSLFLNQYVDNLLQLDSNIINLDVLFAKAKFIGKKASKPIIDLKNIFLFKNLYHPLIDEDICVPLNLYKKEDVSGYIITGPNAGGKTVVLKTIGLYQLLVQTCYFIRSSDPCTFSFFKNFLVDIGDLQSLEASLSTFSAHITNINLFFNNYLNNSLVLIDEIASGTNPNEGEALARAIIDHLVLNKSTFFITTHYNNLKDYPLTNKSVINASMIFKEKDNTPTFKLQEGVPGSSYALKICKNLNLIPSIIDNATTYLNSKKSPLDNLLEDEIDKYKKENFVLQQEKEELNKRVLELNQLSSSINKEKQEIYNNAAREANLIIKNAKEEAFKILDDLKKEGIKLKENALLSSKINKLKEEEIVSNEYLNIGDYVFIIPYNTTGKIVGIKKNLYTVSFSNFNLQFKKTDLKKTEYKEEKKEFKKVSIIKASTLTDLKLDLRGVRYIEVDSLLNSFLDKAVLNKIEEVSIIHGFGTGVIRKRVHELLKNNKHVKSFRLGKEGEGLGGATICKLK